MHSLSELQSQVKQIFDSESFLHEPKELYQPIEYTISLGGKRIRPLLLLAANDLFGGETGNCRDAAIAIELFHNFTLLHDDLMDQSPIRRGQPTVYRKWNENTAILSGDAMHILAWQYILKKPHKNLHDILLTFQQTSLEVHHGQQYDINFEQQQNVSIDDYITMIRLKTAVLLACALKIGALLADAPQDDIDNLYNFGIDIGLAFQLRDDLLDTYGDTKTFGKQTGTDIKDNKKTFLLLKAIEKGSPQQQARLRELFSTTPDNPDAKIKEVIDIYNQLGIRNDTELLIRQYHTSAIQYLEKINTPDTAKQPLIQLSEKLLDRNI